MELEDQGLQAETVLLDHLVLEAEMGSVEATLLLFTARRTLYQNVRAMLPNFGRATV